MSENSDENGKPEKKPVTYDHYLVKGDYGSDADVGVITVKDDFDSRRHHWIHLPDGQVRKWYEKEQISKAKAEEMEAFEMAPRLKVSYRPISKFIHEHHEIVLVLWFILLAVLFVDGLIFLCIEQFFAKGVALMQSFWGKLINTIIFWIFGILSVMEVTCLYASVRFENNTKDDKRPRIWWLEQQKRRDNKKDIGWI